MHPLVLRRPDSSGVRERLSGVWSSVFYMGAWNSKGEEPVSVICARHGVLDDGRALKNDFETEFYRTVASERRRSERVGPVDLGAR